MKICVKLLLSSGHISATLLFYQWYESDEPAVVASTINLRFSIASTQQNHQTVMFDRRRRPRRQQQRR